MQSLDQSLRIIPGSQVKQTDLFFCRPSLILFADVRFSLHQIYSMIRCHHWKTTPVGVSVSLGAVLNPS